MAATKYKGTIYFREFLSEAEEARRSAQTDREKRMCYWGVKFEDYMTAPSECGPLCCCWMPMSKEVCFLWDVLAHIHMLFTLVFRLHL